MTGPVVLKINYNKKSDIVNMKDKKKKRKKDRVCKEENSLSALTAFISLSIICVNFLHCLIPDCEICVEGQSDNVRNFIPSLP